MGRRLERHVDFDLADRILASGPIKKLPVTKTKKKPRGAHTYRGMRRNFRRIMRAEQLAERRSAT